MRQLERDIALMVAEVEEGLRLAGHLGTAQTHAGWYTVRLPWAT